MPIQIIEWLQSWFVKSWYVIEPVPFWYDINFHKIITSFCLWQFIPFNSQTTGVLSVICSPNNVCVTLNSARCKQNFSVNNFIDLNLDTWMSYWIWNDPYFILFNQKNSLFIFRIDAVSFGPSNVFKWLGTNHKTLSRWQICWIKNQRLGWFTRSSYKSACYTSTEINAKWNVSGRWIVKSSIQIMEPNINFDASTNYV